MTESLNKSIRANPNGDMPVIDVTAYIDPTAQIIGNVHIGPRVYVGPYAVIRADESDDKGQVHSIEIQAECNVQDGVIIHALGGTQVSVGKRTALAHGCVVHGPCKLGTECFVGFRAVVYKSELGDGTFVSAGAVVQGVDLEANTFVEPAVAISSKEDTAKLTKTSEANKEFMKKVVNANLTLTKGYNQLGQK